MGMKNGRWTNPATELSAQRQFDVYCDAKLDDNSVPEIAKAHDLTEEQVEWCLRNMVLALSEPWILDNAQGEIGCTDEALARLLEIPQERLMAARKEGTLMTHADLRTVAKLYRSYKIDMDAITNEELIPGEEDELPTVEPPPEVSTKGIPHVVLDKEKHLDLDDKEKQPIKLPTGKVQMPPGVPNMPPHTDRAQPTPKPKREFFNVRAVFEAGQDYKTLVDTVEFLRMDIKDLKEQLERKERELLRAEADKSKIAKWINDEEDDDRD